MSNFKRSSIYVHFDNLDQKIVKPWLSLLKKRFWDVMDSSQYSHMSPVHSLAKYDLVVLVISKNVYTPDGEIKPQINEFFNTTSKAIGKNIILITMGEAKIPDSFSDDNLAIYQYKSKDSTVNFLEYLRGQGAIAKLKSELENINDAKLAGLSANVDSLSSQVYQLKDQISSESKASEIKVENLLKKIEDIKSYLAWVIAQSEDSVKESVSSSALSLDTNKSFESLSAVMINMSQQVKELENKIQGFTEDFKKRAFSAAPNSMLYFMVAITAVYLVTALFTFSALSQMSLRIQSVLSPINVDTPIPSITSTKVVKTPAPVTPSMLNPTQVLEMVFGEIDNQFKNNFKSNIAFNKPQQMKKDETAIVELLLNPSLSLSELATQIVSNGGFVTSTSEPNVLIDPNGGIHQVEISKIDITPRMKAVLKSQDSEAFTVTEMHDNAEQVVSSVETTAWRWSVTAKKEGSQTLELVIYQLVKYDGKEFWHEVETYRTNIEVEVTLADRVKSLDWYWIAGFIVTLIVAVVTIWKWLDERKKKPGVVQVKIVEDKKKGK